MTSSERDKTMEARSILMESGPCPTVKPQGGNHLLRTISRRRTAGGTTAATYTAVAAAVTTWWGAPAGFRGWPVATFLSGLDGNARNITTIIRHRWITVTNTNTTFAAKMLREGCDDSFPRRFQLIKFKECACLVTDYFQVFDWTETSRKNCAEIVGVDRLNYALE